MPEPSPAVDHVLEQILGQEEVSQKPADASMAAIVPVHNDFRAEPTPPLVPPIPSPLSQPEPEPQQMREPERTEAISTQPVLDEQAKAEDAASDDAEIEAKRLALTETKVRALIKKIKFPVWPFKGHSCSREYLDARNNVIDAYFRHVLAGGDEREFDAAPWIKVWAAPNKSTSSSQRNGRSTRGRGAKKSQSSRKAMAEEAKENEPSLDDEEE
ncbi:hypothetical protein BJ508DRAFT_329438 [Ascobolus immersus RN42]|uniref:Uncharacterized protein n=1 Tax=Ascobolus immersus RN42 TaxID=1160509 RepID=A0A3N4I939_ASCIM|nr:hypothetical protein BJ508DRAFT_329438 [Ascobolus immersus RN42]